MRLPQANNFVVGSILRQASLTDESTLNIITFCTHERYEQSLAKTGHNFYALKSGKTWNSNYGVQPENYHQVSKLLEHIDYDLVLCQDSGRYPEARQVADMYNLPLVLLTHTLPDVRYDINNQTKIMQSLEADHFVFISQYSVQQWDMERRDDVSVIRHGIDFDFWNEYQVAVEDRLAGTVISVANHFPDRDWCLGWELWCDIVGFDNQSGSLPKGVTLVGDNQPLSQSASPHVLRKKYNESVVFLNTSLHSPVPMSLLEAMACGCIPVSTETCMIPEVITEGVDGFMSNDPDTLKTLVDRLKNDPDYAATYGNNAKQTIREHYNLDRFTKEWNELFQKVIKKYESLLFPN